ncbi:MAG: class I SAM-dependent methyltransferase [Rhizobiaceae bacterium]|nr:class I SAM-dependent methyltransferase [Rhizobiaceae bacterium]MCV0405591.1 class I SAM-dependent methyltransferase [Rhizobiaceae bacterium]
MKPWEDLIALNNFVDPALDVLGPARQYKAGDTNPIDWDKRLGDMIEPALQRDTYPLPMTKDREGYYGDNHYSYWASGLQDYKNITECCARLGVDLRSYLDFGCATGRVIRHFAVNSPEVEVLGCDINRAHVEWVAQHLPASIKVFQNHSVPALPLPDNSLDFFSAYSVFTHIEAFETSWLMEMRRILRPGGLAWVTLHTEHTWEEMTETWPLYRGLRNHPDFDKSTPRPPLERDRTIFRWKTDASYSSNVFYKMKYIRKVWGRFFEIAEFHRRFPNFQDVVILRKPG